MLERPVGDLFPTIYGLLPDLVDDLGPLITVKRSEEALVWRTFSAQSPNTVGD